MPSYRTGTIYAEITNCGRYSRMRPHASAVSIMTNRENRFVESGGLTNAIAKLAKKVMGEN